MPDSLHLPVGREAQKRIAEEWLVAQATGVARGSVRTLVRESWARSRKTRVRADLTHAPMAWDEDGLLAARERTDWLGFAARVVAAHGGAYADGGHILTLFDADGRMLASEGDPHALDGLHGINFRPGALWAEEAVGTNGPGTALATGRPVHIIGAEHFCQAWHQWHCAAVPFRDPATGGVLGVVDVSGFRDAAHPHTLTLVVAIAVAIEQMFAAREAERRVGVLRRYGDLASRFPGDALVAVDRAGSVLSASHAVPAPLHPLAPLSDPLRGALAHAVSASASDSPREVWIPIDGGREAVAHPVFDGRTPVGACLVVRAPASHRRSLSGGSSSIDRPREGHGHGGGRTHYSLYDLVGDAPGLVEAHRVAVAAAANLLPVLITGESGTGKEVFAQGIHAASARAGKPFVAVNCAALPSELIESELFGYVGGAFSGARREGSAGKFEAADGGTIFLDELGELPPAAQASLLRVLQEGEVTRVGAAHARPVDVRVIAATNCDVAARLASGGLRQDLFYRLSVLTIDLPALRDRRADVRRLALRFLAEAEAELGRPGHCFAPEVLDAFRAHPWPGNVRELKNLVRRLVALVPHDEITLADLPAAFREGTDASPARSIEIEVDPANTSMSGALRDEPSPETSAARERIARAVERSATMAEAAALLGITRSTLYRQMERYGLEPHRVVRSEG